MEVTFYTYMRNKFALLYFNHTFLLKYPNKTIIHFVNDALSQLETKIESYISLAK